MSGNENRRRKKIEAKRSKKKEKQRSIAQFESSGNAAKLALAQSWPIAQSLVTSNWEEQSICNSFIIRKSAHGQTAAVMFLVDLFCLGVKNVFVFYGSEVEWNKFLTRRRDKGSKLDSTSPEFVRKLVEGSVQFARKFGIEPHRDYKLCSQIFGDIDAASCATQITYGQDGKPHFINGPYDTPERIRKIMALLQQNAGPENFNFSLATGNIDITDVADDDDDEDLLDDVEINEGSNRSPHQI